MWQSCPMRCYDQRSSLWANTEKQHQSVAAAAFSEGMALFIRQSGSSRRGGLCMVGKENYLREGLGQ